jgi:hypothetical protein
MPVNLTLGNPLPEAHAFELLDRGKHLSEVTPFKKRSLMG